MVRHFLIQRKYCRQWEGISCSMKKISTRSDSYGSREEIPARRLALSMCATWTHKGTQPTTIRRQQCTDNLLASVDDDEEAIKVIDESKFVNQQAGFRVRGWKSNSPAVKQQLGEEPTLNRFQWTSKWKVMELRRSWVCGGWVQEPTTLHSCYVSTRVIITFFPARDLQLSVT